jgi:hypothetical protein
MRLRSDLGSHTHHSSPVLQQKEQERVLRFDVLENLKFLQHDQKINAVHLEEREREREKTSLLSPGRESQKGLLIVVMMGGFYSHPPSSF